MNLHNPISLLSNLYIYFIESQVWTSCLSLCLTFNKIIGINVDQVAADTLGRGKSQRQILVSEVKSC